MSLQSLIDNPKELLELINDCLKPKEVEKKENGEVTNTLFSQVPDAHSLTPNQEAIVVPLVLLGVCTYGPEGLAGFLCEAFRAAVRSCFS